MIESLNGLDLPEHRITSVEQVHLTLQFIGDTPAKRLDETIESVARAASSIGAFELTPRRLITSPGKGAARLVAISTDAPAPLLELHRRLVHRLARSPRNNAGDRFLPHLTLCRFAQPTPGVQIDQPIELPAFEVHTVLLMKSRLRTDGAVHDEIAAVELD